MRIALIGTRAVPALYGGSETCVEEVSKRLVASGHQVLVFCRPSDVVAEDRNPPRSTSACGWSTSRGAESLPPGRLVGPAAARRGVRERLVLLAGTRWRLQPLAAAAAGAGAYTVAYDVVFNRQVIGDIGQFFTTSKASAATTGTTWRPATNGSATGWPTHLSAYATLRWSHRSGAAGALARL
jgi:hypothetical protein